MSNGFLNGVGRTRLLQSLADYFMLKHRRRPDAMRQQEYRDSLALYETVLAGFLADPGSRANLHRGLARHLVRAPV